MKNDKIYFVSNNSNKYKEIAKVIPYVEQLKVNEIPEIQSLDIKEVIKHKLLSAKKKIRKKNYSLFVEDTGLYLCALNEFPGPLIKFMLASIGNEGIFNICYKMKSFEARATTSFGLYDSKTSDISFYSATIKGLITSPRGNAGFGWDKIFIPEGSEKTFAEMETVDEKNKYSMRYMALEKLLNNLNNK